jgi:ribosomal protein S18 acetylase RimI-like enzyme
VKATLRPYRPDDFETLFAIDQLCYDPAIAYSRRELRNYLRFPGADCILAEAAGKTIGFCITAREKGLGYVITMDVLAEHRRRGIGSALLHEAEQRLASHGVLQIALETATGNDAAIAFWQRHGYRNVGLRKGYYPGGRDALAMLKQLPITKTPPPAAASSKTRG